MGAVRWAGARPDRRISRTTTYRSVGGKLASACHDLKLGNVGIMEVAQNGRHWIKHASEDPQPDRRDLLTRSVSRYFKRI
jgi:hypothetical protein